MMISKAVLALGLGAFISASGPAMARADSAVPQPAVATTAQPQAGIIEVADGCGWGRYRGPGGACHQFGRGPYPGGYYGPGYYAPYPGSYYPQPANGWNGCPAGYWRGPWGHCRNTPFHGRMPDGSWQ
jgi:hypothetical protein